MSRVCHPWPGAQAGRSAPAAQHPEYPDHHGHTAGGPGHAAAARPSRAPDRRGVVPVPGRLGRFVYRRAVIRRAKGWGKDPLAAALACVEFLGPCRVGELRRDGDPVAVAHPSPWVHIAAVNQDQTTNTMSLIPGMLAPAAVTHYRLDIGKDVIYSAAGGRIQAVTSSPHALEGGRPTPGDRWGTQHWQANNAGHKMARVIRRNLGKSRDGAARLVELTNAHEPGLDSVAEHSYDAWRAMVERRTPRRGLLYDSREAPPTVDLADRASLRAGLAAAYGDSTWVDLDRLIEEIYDPNTPPSEARRFYLNQITAAEDAWITAHEWDACQVDDLILPGDVVVLGFDGSRADDATALAVCRLHDGLLDLAAVWEKPRRAGRRRLGSPRDQVDDAVDHTFARYNVVGFYADVAGFESYVDEWSVRYADRLKVKASPRSQVGWDMRARVGDFTRRGAETLRAAIVDRTLRHTGHPCCAGTSSTPDAGPTGGASRSARNTASPRVRSTPSPPRCWPASPARMHSPPAPASPTERARYGHFDMRRHWPTGV